MRKNEPQLVLRHTGQSTKPVTLRFSVRQGRRGATSKYAMKVADFAPRQAHSLVALLGGLNEACYGIREQAERLARFLRRGDLIRDNLAEWDEYAPGVSAALEALQQPAAVAVEPRPEPVEPEPAEPVSETTPEPAEPEPAEPEPGHLPGHALRTELPAQVAAVHARMAELAQEGPTQVVPVETEEPLQAGGAAAAVAARIQEIEEASEQQVLEDAPFPPGEPSGDWTVAQLQAYAASKGIDVSGVRGLPALLRVIHQSQ